MTDGGRDPRPGLEESSLLLALSEAISGTLELRSVLQTVTDISTQLSGASFGAFFYSAWPVATVTLAAGDRLVLYTDVSRDRAGRRCRPPTGAG